MCAVPCTLELDPSEPPHVENRLSRHPTIPEYNDMVVAKRIYIGLESFWLYRRRDQVIDISVSHHPRLSRMPPPPHCISSFSLFACERHKIRCLQHPWCQEFQLCHPSIQSSQFSTM